MGACVGEMCERKWGERGLAQENVVKVLGSFKCGCALTFSRVLALARYRNRSLIC